MLVVEAQALNALVGHVLMVCRDLKTTTGKKPLWEHLNSDLARSVVIGALSTLTRGDQIIEEKTQLVHITPEGEMVMFPPSHPPEPAKPKRQVMTLDELDEAIAHVESRFTIGPDGVTSRAPTGELYVEVCTGGTKDEGERRPCWCLTPELAVEFWSAAVWKYAGLHGPDQDRKTLYWRIRPELESLIVPSGHPAIVPDMKLWSVYSRLLISNKPAISSAAA